ncbi:MAG: hypothetical protein H7255_12300 [Ramlibacter sp.]|nr:hypothetical protein [Ramlibacter sp.]
MADYARLAVARELLARGYERTVWLDADLLVFAPDNLTVDVTDSFSYCYEVWLGRDKQGLLKAMTHVNNAITVFVKGNKGKTYLDFFIDAAERTAFSLDVVPKIAISTQFLTRLRQALPFHLLMNVGLFSPLVLADLAGGTSRVLPAYGAALRQPLACANLCASIVGETKHGVVITDAMCDTVVQKCLESKGEIVNRFVNASVAAR